MVVVLRVESRVSTWRRRWWLGWGSVVGSGHVGRRKVERGESGERNARNYADQEINNDPLTALL